jgi:hypothetical protein
MEASIVGSNSLILTRFIIGYTGEGVNPRLLRRAGGQGLGHGREKGMAAGRAAESKNPLQVRKRGGEHLRACPSKRAVNFNGAEALIRLWAEQKEFLRIGPSNGAGME